MEKLGYVLWESLTLLFVTLAGLAILIIRRKACGRPVFTVLDWLTYFGDVQVKMSKIKLAFRLFCAVVLCSLLALISHALLAHVGPAVYSVAFVFTCLGIVKAALK